MEEILTWFSNLGRLKMWLQCTMKEILIWFSILMQLKTSLQSTRKEILNWFSNLGRLKTWLHSTMKDILTRFFTWSWRQLKTWLDSNMKGIFTWFSTLRSLKKLVALDSYEGNFDMNFLFMASQILIAEQKRKRFWHDIPREGSSKLRCRALWNRF